MRDFGSEEPELEGEESCNMIMQDDRKFIRACLKGSSVIMYQSQVLLRRGVEGLISCCDVRLKD